MQKIGLTEEGKKDQKILEELRKFNENALQTSKDFLGVRLDVSNAMKDSILRACNTWNAL